MSSKENIAKKESKILGEHAGKFNLNVGLFNVSKSSKVISNGLGTG